MAQIGKGTTLANSSTQGGSYTALGALTDVTPPKVKVGKIETTEYDSASSTKEFISAVWKEHEDVPFKLNYAKADVATVNALVGVESWWKITLPDGSTFNFPGFVSEWGTTTPNQDKMENMGTMTVTGVVTWTPAA